MSQNGFGQGLDVFDLNVEATFQQSPRLAAQDQKLNRPRSGAPADQFVDEVRDAVAADTRLANDGQRVADHVITDRNAADQIWQRMISSAAKTGWTSS